MDNNKVIVKDTPEIGKGLFADEDIKKGELIADFSNGIIYNAEKISLLPKEIQDHAIQFEEHKWMDTQGIGRFINHSCEPNCGIKGRFQIIAMRNIKKGEWLTYDYEMTEDSDWKMECICGKKSCRKIIGAYKNMPKNMQERYKNYISLWLINKYNDIKNQ